MSAPPISGLHTWVVWEKVFVRRGFGAMRMTWKVVSSHKTRVAADITVKRGHGRIARRNSHGAPA